MSVPVFPASDVPASLPAGVRLIGGEMMAWTDDAPEYDRVPASGVVSAYLLDRLVPADSAILLAGPHAPELVDQLADRGRSLTCLVRSVLDARDLGLRYESRADVAIECGALDKFSTPGPFDVIVALSGLKSLLSMDGADLAWTECLDRLTAVLAPGGSLLLATENELGVHRLVDAGPPSGRHGDMDWAPRTDDTTPVGPAALAGELTARGHAVVRTYAAFPAPTAPAVLVAAELLDDRPVAQDALGSLIAAAFARGFAGRTVLSDPAKLARETLRSGLGARLAPAWIAVAGGTDWPAPDALVSSGPATVCELSLEDGRRQVVGADTALASGRVVVEPDRLNGPLPAGSTVEELLITACATEDVRQVKDILRPFGQWLADQTKDGQLPAELVFATTDNVVFDGSRWALLDPSHRLTEALPFEVAFARILQGFTGRLTTSGDRHPWPEWIDPAGLTVTLSGMAGYPVDEATCAKARELDTEIAEALGLPAPAAEHVPSGHRTLQAEVVRLRDELEAANGQVKGLERLLTAREKTIKQRDAKIRRLETQLTTGKKVLRTVQGSLGSRVGRPMVAGRRVGRKVIRRLRRR